MKVIHRIIAVATIPLLSACSSVGVIDNQPIDAEFDRISSVSGGSFTSAYYGLYGDRLFDDFEDRLLRKDVQGALTRGVLNPLHLLSRKSRTEVAIDYYDRHIFDGKTFAEAESPTISAYAP